MIDREDLGSWLDGPQQSLPEGSWPGRRLGMPESGRGSVAPIWRRFAALFIDWGISYGVSLLFFGGNEWSILAVYSLQCLVLLPTLGFTAGYWALGVLLIGSTGDRASLWQVLIRHVLWCLVIPGVVYNVDRRGLHDLTANTAVVRR